MVLFLIPLLAALWVGITTAASYVKDAVITIVQAVFTIIQTFVQSAPPQFKILMFLFFLVTIGNVLSTFYLGMTYACTSTGQLYRAPDAISGLGNAFRLGLFGFTVADRNQFITANYQATTPTPTATYTKCDASTPKMFSYGIDVLSYQLWLLLSLMIFGAPLAWSYYRAMGVLG